MRLPSLRLPSFPAGATSSLQRNLYNILAVIFIIVIALGYLYFYSALIAPALEARNMLAAQVSEARLLAQSRGIVFDSPDNLQARLNSLNATLATASKSFLTQVQISDYIKRLYIYADESRVTIVDLQTTIRSSVAAPIPTPTATRPVTATAAAATPAPPPPMPGQTAQPTLLLSPTPTRPPASLTPTFTPTRAPAAPTGPGTDLFRVTTVRLQVRGPAIQLVEFVSRIRETVMPGVIVTVLNLDQGEQNALLNLEIAMVSSAAPETATPRPSASAPTQAPTVATLVPSPPPPPSLTATPLPTIVYPTLTPTPTATATLVPTAASQITYVVRAGDTLFSIARRYNTTVEAIMAANRMPNYNIYIGQVLIIPR